LIWGPLALIAGTVAQVYYGEASECARHNPRQLEALFYNIEKTLLKVIIFPVMVFALAAPHLFPVVFGAEWYEAGRFMKLLGLTFVVMLVVGPVFHTLNILERQAWLFASDAMGSALIVGGLMLAYKLGWPAERAVMVYGGSMILIYSVLFLLVKAAISARVNGG